jgi:hypothetical protein
VAGVAGTVVSGVGSALSSGIGYIWKGKESGNTGSSGGHKMMGFGSDSYGGSGGNSYYNPPISSY